MQVTTFTRFVIILLALTLLHGISTAQHWQVTEMAPMPERVSNSAVAEGQVDGTDYIYSFAGIDSTKLYSGIHLRAFRYNVQGDFWETIPPLPDNMGKIAPSASRVGDVIYIIGGYHVFASGSEESSDKVHRYDLASNSYLTDGAPIPVPIDDQVQAVWRDSLIYVITGWSNFGNVPDVQIYDPANDNWLVGTPTPNNHDYKSFGSTGVIFNDTIYYFGGARSSGSFGIQNDFRKGIINPNDPTDIEWSTGILANDVAGYRMAATISRDQVFWLGGSGVTYNFNGIAYNGSGGVPPLHRSLLFDPATGSFDIDTSNDLPMDLRALGDINDTLKYIVGGMLDNQWVSNRTFRLERLQPTVPTHHPAADRHPIRIYPNPASEKIFVEAPYPISRLRVLHTTGTLIQEIPNPEMEISVHHLPTGLYLLQFVTENSIFTQSWVKD